MTMVASASWIVVYGLNDGDRYPNEVYEGIINLAIDERTLVKYQNGKFESVDLGIEIPEDPEAEFHQNDVEGADDWYTSQDND